MFFAREPSLASKEWFPRASSTKAVKNNRSYLISNTPQKGEEMANTPFFIGDT